MKRLGYFSLTLFFTCSLLLLPSALKAGIVVVNGLTHQFDIIPGEIYRGAIEIQNTGDTEQPVKLYLRDYFFNKEGESFYDAPGSQERSNANWIDVSPSYLVLQPREKTMVTYEIRVPQEIELTGTYWSVIMVEEESPVSANSGAKGLTIQTQLRYAVQVATTAGNTGKRNLTFFGIKPVKEDGMQLLAVEIENKGELLFKPVVSVELFDEQGNSVGIFYSLRKKLYPNTSSRFLIDLKGIAPGNYQSLVLADCGEEDVFGINVPLEINNE